MMKTSKECEYCDEGTMNLVRKSPNCLRWVCTTCWATHRIDLKQLNQYITTQKLTKHHNRPTKNVGT